MRSNGLSATDVVIVVTVAAVDASAEVFVPALECLPALGFGVRVLLEVARDELNQERVQVLSGHVRKLVAFPGAELAEVVLEGSEVARKPAGLIGHGFRGIAPSHLPDVLQTGLCDGTREVGHTVAIGSNEAGDIEFHGLTSFFARYANLGPLSGHRSSYFAVALSTAETALASPVSVYETPPGEVNS